MLADLLLSEAMEGKGPQPAPQPKRLEADGEGPGPRCGHTLTAISATAEGPATRLVAFGGATALEGDGKTGVRLAGVTAEVHMLDVRSGVWERVEAEGEPPSPRAAHAATAVGEMLVIHGGIGPSGLAGDSLHVLDFTGSGSNPPKWHTISAEGSAPKPRYAHTLAFVDNRFLVIFGGSDGRSVLSDAHCLDTGKKPYEWRALKGTGEHPEPRMYASACTRPDGLMLLCGGRNKSNTALADAYGLCHHRDGSWEWTKAPTQCPAARYQHATAAVGARMHVLGGSLGGAQPVSAESSVVVMDTSESGRGAWAGVVEEGAQGLKRCRHAATAAGPFIFLHGGLRGGSLLSDTLVADDSQGRELSGLVDVHAPPWKAWLAAFGHGKGDGSMHLQEAAAEEARAAREALGMGWSKTDNKRDNDERDRRSSNWRVVSERDQHAVTLHHRAVVSGESGEKEGGRLARQMSIDRFEHEARRVKPAAEDGTAHLRRKSSLSGAPKRALQELLRPDDWTPREDGSFAFSLDDIMEISDRAEEQMRSEPTVLRVAPPVKIFGDLHGQFSDLMRLFAEFGAPTTAGDITYIDYLFLGDYVDRGKNSLEVMTLLFALKVENPSNFHLVRGNHEAVDINALFGFREECHRRLGNEEGEQAWRRMNAVFDHMPLAAVVGSKILCLHGGIGRSINHVSQIDELERPIGMDKGGQVLLDLLWSDPTADDSIEGIQPSPRGPGLVTFGPDRVEAFCDRNGLQLIVRAHECVMDGFERFAGGRLMTVFSAANYCGTANNAGAILVVGRDLTVVPKLIRPT